MLEVSRRLSTMLWLNLLALLGFLAISCDGSET